MKRFLILVIASFLTFNILFYTISKNNYVRATEWTPVQSITDTTKAVITWILMQAGFTWLAWDTASEKINYIIDDVINEGIVRNEDIVSTTDGRTGMELSDELIQRVEGYTMDIQANPIISTNNGPKVQWKNYPESPYNTVDYPYQVVCVSGGPWLFMGKSKMYYDSASGNILSANPFTIARCNDGISWAVQMVGTSFCIGNTMVEANNDVYTDNNYNVVHFAKTIISELDYTNDFKDVIGIPNEWENTPTADVIVLKPEITSPADIISNPDAITDKYGISGTIDESIDEPVPIPADEVTGLQRIIEAIKNLGLSLYNTIVQAVETALAWLFDFTEGKKTQNTNVPNLFDLMLLIILALIRLFMAVTSMLIRLKDIPASTELLNSNVVAGIDFLKNQSVLPGGIKFMTAITGAAVIVQIGGMVAITRKAIHRSEELTGA
jgi:hypothetical protein